jgi:translation initiation factor 2 beta subunit (eIF-2beta)/eIF-5
MNIGGDIYKALGGLAKHHKEHDKLAKLFQKEINSAKLPPAVAKNMEKLMKTQAGMINGMVKGLQDAEKATKDSIESIVKGDGGAEMALLKELEKTINQQGDIVKRLIKQASK